MLIVILGIGAAGYIVRTDRQNNTILSPLAEPVESKSVFDFLRPKKDSDELRSVIKKQVGSAWNNYSVYVSDLNSPFTMGINESTIFTGASVNKVPILAALYDEAQKGNVNFDKIITLQEEDIQDYGTGSIRYDSPGTTYSVKTLVRLAAQKSDNTAAHLLANYVVTIPVVQSYIDSWRMTQTDMAGNKTSNKDMEILFRKIVNGQVVNSALTAELLGFLKDSDFEDRIPALLPKDATVYHKIGTGPGEIHDSGVVVSGKMKYYIGILTEGVTDSEGAATLSAQISKTVYDYMKSHL
jgi:beta-lactamase class A